MASASCIAASADGTLPGKLQLLAGEQQHLLDLGQRHLVARGREFAIQRLQRRLLRPAIPPSRVSSSAIFACASRRSSCASLTVACVDLSARFQIGEDAWRHRYAATMRA